MHTNEEHGPVHGVDIPLDEGPQKIPE